MARKVIVYEPEEHYPIPYPVDSVKWNEKLVETAGFVPLAVRFKQMEQAGIRAQFFASEFSSKDVQDMYLNHPEFDLTPDDDIEEMIEKMELRARWIQSVKDKARERNLNETTVKSDDEPKAKKKDEESVSKDEN